MAEKQENTAPAAPAAKAGSPVLLWIILTGVSLVGAAGVSWALAEFVLLPKLKSISTASAEHGSAAAPEEAVAPIVPTPPPGAAAKSGGGHGGHGGSSDPVSDTRTYAFNNIVVNLSGTMGTRYLKVSFVVISQRTDLAPLMESRHIEMQDATINILSSLTLADLEESGAKNLIRSRLANAYNELFRARIVEQIFFSEFVVQ